MNYRLAVVFILLMVAGSIQAKLTDDGLNGLTNINKIMLLAGSATHPCKNYFFQEITKNFIKLDEMEDFDMSIQGNQLKASFRIKKHKIAVSGQIKYFSPPGNLRIKIQEARKTGFFGFDVKDRLLEAITDLNHEGIKIDGDDVILKL